MSEKTAKKIRRIKAKKGELSSVVINKDTDIDSLLSDITKDPQEPKFIIVDLFCGAGGTTTGFAMAKNGIAKVIACVNHDPMAIVSHWANHPEVFHFEEDIRTLDLTNLVRIVDYHRALYPNAKLILWASLECTNFSKAKGGQPRDADSRTLADHLPRYITAIHPDYIQIENVVEFMSWGPLRIACKKELKKGCPDKGVYPQCELKFCYNKKTKKEEYAWIPESKKNGQDWLKWKQIIDGMGYHNDWRELNSADYGAYTSRNRFFQCFAKIGLPIVWPTPTHAKRATQKLELFDTPLMKWKAVKDVLDFSDNGESIFNRKKPLVDRTLTRIYSGLVKFVANGDESFLVKYNSMNQNGGYTAPGTEEPCPVISCQNRIGIANVSFVSNYKSGNPNDKNHPISEPMGTITTKPTQALVNTEFLVNYNHSSKTNNVNDPAPTLLTHDKLGIASPSFLAKYYGNGNNISSIENPAGTVTTKDRFQIVQPIWLDKMYNGEKNNFQSIERPSGTITANDHHQIVQTQWIDRNFTGGGQISSIDDPAGSILNVPKMNLVNVQPFIMQGQFNNKGNSIEEPAPTLLASRHHHYIVNPSYQGNVSSIENPCCVIVARQDKSPLYLMQICESNCFVPIYDNDTEIMRKIKICMAAYGISDIKLRMLKVAELLQIQGFSPKYVLKGTQTDQKKFIGNSVVPLVVKAWIEALSNKFKELAKAA